MSVNKQLVDYILLRMFAGIRTQILVGIAFVFNILCYLDLGSERRNFWKLAVQQALILCIGTMGTKLDRLRPR